VDTSNNPVVSIIIVSWKVPALLRECLNSVFDQAENGHAMEVIVVDNNSDDGSVEMVRAEFPGVAIVANARNVGFGAANNQAVPLCHGKYLLLLNPDTVVIDGAVDRLVEMMEASPSTAVMGARLLNTDGTLQRWTGGAFPTLWNVACHYLFLSRALPRSLRPKPLYLEYDARTDLDVDWVTGACMILPRRSVEDSIFDPGFFMYGEDMEFCYRVKRAGGTVVYSPRASVIHHQGASMKQQEGDALLSSLKGPRRFFSMTHPKFKVFLFDALTVMGFFIRWIAFATAARLKANSAYRQRCASSRRYMTFALRVMRGQ
jgi:GT2 family glycosyltransferase